MAKAAPDGYTILMGNIGTQAINPSLYKKMPYDAAGAFTPIALVAELPLAMMVNPQVAAKDAKAAKPVPPLERSSLMAYKSAELDFRYQRFDRARQGLNAVHVDMAANTPVPV